MKVLNLYAGIGGNRKLWPDTCKVTAVEINPHIAAIYSSLFPQDKIIIGDAHKYLLKHFDEYDFIWSSPPCQTHSRANHTFYATAKNEYKNYFDPKLWQEIVFLKSYCKKKWVVENVYPYYETLIKPMGSIDRHLFWSNFYIPQMGCLNDNSDPVEFVNHKSRYGFDLRGFKIKNKRTILRNLVKPTTGLAIYKLSLGVQKTLI